MLPQKAVQTSTIKEKDWTKSQISLWRGSERHVPSNILHTISIDAREVQSEQITESSQAHASSIATVGQQMNPARQFV